MLFQARILNENHEVLFAGEMVISVFNQLDQNMERQFPGSSFFLHELEAVDQSNEILMLPVNFVDPDRTGIIPS